MKQTGISLTELLVGLLLSSFIMLSLAQTYLGCKKHFNSIEAQLAEAFDIEWTSALLRESIRQAGFTPCSSLDNLQHNQDILPAIKIENFPKQSLSLRRMTMYFNKVIEFQSSTQLIVSKGNNIHANQKIIIADCYHAEINTAEEIRQIGQAQHIRLQRPLAYDYLGTAYLGEWIDEKWFIKSNKLKQNSLYYQQGSHSEELSSLIHSLDLREYKNGSKRLLRIKLGLDKGRHQELVVGLRNA